MVPFVPHQSEPDYLLRINDLGVARTLPLQIRTKEPFCEPHQKETRLINCVSSWEWTYEQVRGGEA